MANKSEFHRRFRKCRPGLPSIMRTIDESNESNIRINDPTINMALPLGMVAIRILPFQKQHVGMRWHGRSNPLLKT